MGACFSRPAVPANHLEEAKHKVEFQSTSRVVIVGGGPAGIHMASRLIRAGYKNVVVYEKGPNNKTYGKTHTHFEPETGDVPHEMGTCYLAASYDQIFKLFKEYVGPNALIEPSGGPRGKYGQLLLPAPHLEHEISEKFITADEWVAAVRDTLTVPKVWWDLVPSGVEMVGFVGDAVRYAVVHEEIFGKYEYHGLPPKPKPEAMKRINKTFAQFMIGEKLQTLLELCCVGFGSYGLSYDVPAYYGLLFVTPKDVFSFLLSSITDQAKPVQLVRNGFSSLWTSIIEKDKIDIHFESEVTSIDRQLDNPKSPVIIKLKDGSVVEADFLVFAAPTQLFPTLVKDSTPFEQKIASHLSTVGLVVNLFQTEKKAHEYSLTNGLKLGEQALVFYPESLQPATTPKPSGQVYAERNDFMAYAWNREPEVPKRYDVAYQYFFTPQLGKDDECAEAAKEFITNRAKTIVPTPATPEPPKLLYQKNWDYFPHFSQDAINEFLPWEVFERQGENKCFYIGSSLCFESVEDVVRYNNQILKANGIKT